MRIARYRASLRISRRRLILDIYTSLIILAKDNRDAKGG